jgi:hypothetical protein
MTWTVLRSEEFDAWFSTLDEASVVAVASDINVLSIFGPQLGRPRVDTLGGSRHPNLKELRTHHGHHQYRIAFAFDPKRQAIILCAGDKTGVNQERFYKKLISQADSIFDRHLCTIMESSKKRN